MAFLAQMKSAAFPPTTVHRQVVPPPPPPDAMATLHWAVKHPWSLQHFRTASSDEGKAASGGWRLTWPQRRPTIHRILLQQLQHRPQPRAEPASPAPPAQSLKWRGEGDGAVSDHAPRALTGMGGRGEGVFPGRRPEVRVHHGPRL